MLCTVRSYRVWGITHRERPQFRWENYRSKRARVGEVDDYCARHGKEHLVALQHSWHPLLPKEFWVASLRGPETVRYESFELRCYINALAISL